MAVVIRMKRTGRRNRPCYRISVADSRCPRDGNVLENLGLYDPVSPNPDAQHTVNVERARHWLSVGAKPSPTVRSLFKRHDVYEGDFELKPQTPRKRKGRNKATAKRTRKQATKAARAEAKNQRRSERVTVRRAAAKAAAAAESSDDE
ncbi:MAG TPA: 30S ribosomal protein S16 [Planctomycetes bacterium]|nr:30S ribosomal protein S16 [Planctomycetota bacterium]HIK59410.1 30S ribosomal protein S16 [Planctomycetota bacterium]